MVTEQVKRMREMLREAGFTTRDFSVQAERVRRTDRSYGGRYTEFGPAKGVTKGREATMRAFEARHKLADAGLNVTIYEGDEHVSLVLVTEARGGETPFVVRSAGNGARIEKKPVVV